MFLNNLSFDFTKRNFFFLLELRLIVFSYILSFYSKLFFNIKLTLIKSLSKLNYDFFSTRIKNSCVLTGRQGSVYRFFRMSRITLRNAGGQNLIFGLRKSS